MKYIICMTVLTCCTIYFLQRRSFQIKKTTIVDGSLPEVFHSMKLIIISNVYSIKQLTPIASQLTNGIVIVFGHPANRKQSLSTLEQKFKLFHRVFPKYYIFTNEQNKRRKKELDAILLENQFTILQNDNATIYSDDLKSSLKLVGLDEGIKGETQFNYALEGIEEGAYVILLSSHYVTQAVETSIHTINGYIYFDENSLAHKQIKNEWHYNINERHRYLFNRKAVHIITLMSKESNN